MAIGTALVAIILGLVPQAEQAELLKTFRSEFVEITPGQGDFPKTFMMGCEDTAQEEVTLKNDFEIGKYEVPQNLWQSVMGSNPSAWKGPRNSVEKLSFAEARSFCEKATKLMRKAKLIADDEEIRLPSETEWEYAARAGTATKYSFGDDKSELNAYAWSTHNAQGNDPPVGAKKPNPWGLYDIHGYLWEWCARSDEQAKDKPTKKAKQDDKKTGVVRGGSWKDPSEKLTSCSRDEVAADLRDSAVGLRCVLAKIEKNANAN